MATNGFVSVYNMAVALLLCRTFTMRFYTLGEAIMLFELLFSHILPAPKYMHFNISLLGTDALFISFWMFQKIEIKISEIKISLDFLSVV